jgi:hypothetical protein
MGKYQTKHFGEINFYDFSDFLNANVYYDDYRISFLLSDRKIYTDKITVCLNMIDKYFDINNIAKNAIMANYSKNKKIKKYFKYCFKNTGKEERGEIFFSDKYRKIDFKNIIGKLAYPDLGFELSDKDNALIINCYYILSRKYSFCRSNLLCVKIDEELNVLDFNHVETLID